MKSIIKIVVLVILTIIALPFIIVDNLTIKTIDAVIDLWRELWKL